MFGSQEKVEESAGASCVKPLRSSISRMASGLPVVICWASSEKAEEVSRDSGASSIRPLRVPSLPCQSWMKSWLSVLP